MIWIRADGGQEMGIGHIMRCLSVADEIKKLGEKVCFILADEAMKAVLKERNQQYQVLHSDYRKMEEELEKLLPLLEEEAPRMILLDSYFATAAYVSRLREYVPVSYVDDKCELDFPVDILINYNVFAREDLYARELREQCGRLLMGLSYVPLRKEFVNVPYTVREQAETVLITTGGSDRYNLAGRILEEVLKLPETCLLTYYVVSGAYNVHLPYLQKLEEHYSNVHVCSNVKHMAELMEKCDIAVTAGGSTTYELSAVGVPMLCFSYVDNQERIVEGFREKTLVCFAGNYLEQGEGMISKLGESLARLIADRESREKYSKAQRQLVDGEGASRIARCLMED